MTYSILAGKHSADKDHTTMTGGTLSVDKTVQCSEGVTFYTYSIPMFSGEFNEAFHKGVHTAEHLLAYKQDTGSVRSSLEEVSKGTIEGKVILDISPYKTGINTFGFRITSMIPLPVEQIQEFTRISIKRAIEFLENGNPENNQDFQGIPFARAISCGQYNFHNKERAVTDLKAIDGYQLRIEEVSFSSEHTTAYVCDLRFLKPKLDGGNDMTMFSPDFSYKISEIIDRFLGERLGGSLVIVGTFGCMTGMYLCISSATGDESDIAHIHSAIIKVLKEKIDITQLSESENIQFQALLENYKNFGSK